jgi:predicted RNA-binding protein associated with RNAse of E/G family
MYFDSGETILLRQFFRGRVWWATACLVVEDTPAQLVLWLPRGSETMRVTGGLFDDEWDLVPAPLRQPILRLTRGAVAHSVLHFRHPNGTHRGWYVNFEEPLRRTAQGFDFEDWLLDLWRLPNGTWRLLDEDELEEAVKRGVVSPTVASAARAEADRVIAADDFPTGWEDFAADPSWPIPRLPPDWDALTGS